MLVVCSRQQAAGTPSDSGVLEADTHLVVVLGLVPVQRVELPPLEVVQARQRARREGALLARPRPLAGRGRDGLVGVHQRHAARRQRPQPRAQVVAGLGGRRLRVLCRASSEL